MITVVSELAGVVQEVVAPGTGVEKGDTLLILESMKMEIPVEAPVSGRVAGISAGAGEAVDAGDVLCRIDDQAR